MSQALNAVIVEPKQPANACVIWLHGLGADGHDFEDVIPSLHLPATHRIRFIFPHAPAIPVSLNNKMIMPAWFDIFGLGGDSLQDEAGIRKSEGWLKGVLNDLIAEDIPSEKIFLVGFSQGGALALHTALRFEKPLAGVAGLSTYLPLHENLANEQNKANQFISIFLAHGLMDPVVSYWMGQKSLAYLKDAGYDPLWHDYPIAHTVCLPELQSLGRWFKDLLAD